MVKLNSVSRGDGKGIILILLVISSFILIGLSEETSVEKPRSYGLSFLSFFQNLVNNSLTFLGNTFNSIGELRELKYNYEEALKLLENYAGVERELESLRSENSLLKEQMKVSSEMKFKNISSKIIGKEPDNFFSSFIIDKGSLDGIKKDMAVVAYDKGLFGLVGKVEEAGFNSSIVIPITNSQCFVAGRLQKSRNEGLINGKNDNSGNLNMNYVNKRALEDISLNELVITSGMKSLYPAGLFIGRVSTIFSEEYDTSLELELEPVIDMSRIEYVFVMIEDSND
jgi:rod shape-determining protein MreC